MEVSGTPEMSVYTDSPRKIKATSIIYKKSIKPLIEKKRRARINTSLDRLKNLLLQQNGEDSQGSATTRMEKADILEMAVQHLQNRKTTDTLSKSDHIDDFTAGYNYCMSAVSSFLSGAGNVDGLLRSQIMGHLKDSQKLSPESKCEPPPHLDQGQNNGMQNPRSNTETSNPWGSTTWPLDSVREAHERSPFLMHTSLSLPWGHASVSHATYNHSKEVQFTRPPIHMLFHKMYNAPLRTTDCYYYPSPMDQTSSGSRNQQLSPCSAVDYPVLLSPQAPLQNCPAVAQRSLMAPHPNTRPQMWRPW